MEKNAFIRETLMKFEGHKLRDIELISTVIGEEGGQSLYNAGILNLRDLSSYEVKELTKLPGIGKSKAAQLLAVYELCKRNIKQLDNEQISAPSDAYGLCKDMVNEEQEILRLFCLNTKNKVMAVKDVFKGGISSLVVDLRIILKEALRMSASSIIISHNHPSGDPIPSKEDIDITGRLKESSTIIGLSLIDHIIVGKESRYFSFKEKGML